VLMSEHRQRLVARAHHVVELGPGAGPDGGLVIYDGSAVASSWRRPHRPATAVATSPKPRRQTWLRIDGASIHNVTDESVRIPLGTMTCIAGVSGSGKSSFVRGALVPALAAALPPGSVDIADFRTRSGTWARLSGAQGVSALYALDQSAATAQKRSLVWTFLDIAAAIRAAFAADPVAQRLGLAPRDFGTNTGQGRCQRCLGTGLVEDGGECPVCGGMRFGADVLSVRSSGMNLAELLDVPVDLLLKGSLPASLAQPILSSMVELGIGHLALGRSLDTLSGGEIQRLRIVRALAKPESDGAVFVLDEPAGGLHPRDVERVEKALRHIIADGVNSVIVVEHDPYLLSVCDYIVEFGPGGGPDGGRVIATGSPADIRDQDTPTGHALRDDGPRPAARSKPRGTQRLVFASTRAEATRVRAEIRQILGEDVEVPEDEGTMLCPSALLDGRSVSRRPYEVADIDQAILLILLDARAGDPQTYTHAMAKAWSEDPALGLQIHPMLEAMAIWGPKVPRSVIAETRKHLTAMGLGPAVTTANDVRRSRSTGPRLSPVDQSIEGRKAAIRDAWALGGGYVELVDDKGRVRQTASDRLLDLEAGLVGPRHPTPGHFRRFDARGRCPMCKGAGGVTTIAQTHFVRDRAGALLDESSLDPRAAQVLKGVRRSDMVPFFRRLAEEGLWDADARWSNLDPRADALLMHGFWTRPGHGTFLRAGRDIDGSEVSHWLRWDGMVAALDSQLDRSKDANWRDAVRAARHAIPCPTCGGAGLGPIASLLRVGDQPFDTWVREGNLGSFLAAIDAIPRLPPRALRQRERVKRVLATWRGSDARLCAAAPRAAAKEAVACAAEAFSGIPVTWG